jgi:uracil-DNA glycosylase family 4
MIKSHGNSTPRAFFIADYPENKDFQTGYALTGYGGELLRKFCNEQNLDLDNFWRSCLIKEQPPDKSLPDKEFEEALNEQKARYGHILIDEINELKPNLLIPLGEWSFNYITNLRSIRKFRGSVLAPSGEFNLAQENLKVLPILGPYPYLYQEYNLRFVSRIDFGKIHKYLNNNPIPDNKYNIWVARSSTSLRAYLDRAYAECVARGGFLVFDIETYMQIPICISFCFDGFESVCIPILDSSIDIDNRTLMVELIDRILRSPIPKVNQNIKYDWKILERWGFQVNNVVGDTMLAASTLYCEFPKNLGFLTSIYTELPYFKDEGKDFDPDKNKRDRYYLYNAKDSLADHQIYTEQKKELVELGTKEVYDNLMTCLPIYRRMEDRGIRIDETKQQSLLAKYESLYHIQELRCCRLLGKDYFNPLSPKQCYNVIYDELGYRKLRGMKTNQDGLPSTDEESLEYLMVYGEAERSPTFGPLILQVILGARKVQKVIEILELHLHPDKRFRCEYNLAGAETGRSTAGKTTDQLIYLDGNRVLVTNLGHSLQTIGKHGFTLDGMTYGKDLRSMFIPSVGFTFVECDLNSAEARVDRILSGNFDLSVFESPGIHRLTGSWVYGCLPQDIKKGVLVDGVDRYHMAKTVRHAGERNMGVDRLVMMTQRPYRECSEIMTEFHKFQPEIREVFHKDIKRAIDAPAHCLVAPNGRRRDFFGRIQKDTYNEGISFLPQAIVSDQTKFAGIGKTFSDQSIYSWAHLLAESHDSALAEVRCGREYEYGELYKRNVESEPIDFRKCTLARDVQLIIPCEIAIGESWYEDDMREVQLTSKG